MVFQLKSSPVPLPDVSPTTCGRSATLRCQSQGGRGLRSPQFEPSLITPTGWVNSSANVGKTMPFLSPMTGNGEHTIYKNGDLGDGLWYVLPALVLSFFGCYSCYKWKITINSNTHFLWSIKGWPWDDEVRLNKNQVLGFLWAYVLFCRGRSIMDDRWFYLDIWLWCWWWWWWSIDDDDVVVDDDDVDYDVDDDVVVDDDYDDDWNWTWWWWWWWW